MVDIELEIEHMGNFIPDKFYRMLDDEIQKLEDRAYGEKPSIVVGADRWPGESGIDQLLTIAKIEALKTVRDCVLKSIE